MGSPQADTGGRLEQRRPQAGYIPTEEEKQVLRDCMSESFWYRSVPFSIISIVTTQTLISKGILATSSRFGAIPKLAFAGIFGYFAGKISYINVCRQKLMKLENYSADTFGRQGQKRQIQLSPDGAATSQVQSFAPPAAEPPSRVFSSNYDNSPATVPFSTSVNESSTSGIVYNTGQEAESALEESSKRKLVRYDELRSNNRNISNVAESPTPRTAVEDRKPWKKEKKNQYGDVWED